MEKIKNKKQDHQKQDIPAILSRLKRPKKALITAGMPYANGPLHIGHLAGAHLPADIYSRWMKMLIGKENVLFVCGTDDHGSTSEVASKKQGVETRDFIDHIHLGQKKTLDHYSIQLDIYSGTSKKNNFLDHQKLCQDFLGKLHRNKLLKKKTSEQWFDPELSLFLPDRYVQGSCPNKECDNQNAYSDDCDLCGSQYEPCELIGPRSTVSKAVPILKETDHWFLNMWQVTDQLVDWLSGKQKVWRKSTMSEVMGTVLPSLFFPNTFEPKFKELRKDLPEHKTRYAPGKKILVQFSRLDDLHEGRTLLLQNGIESKLLDGWAHRSITRDVAWGVPVPTDIEEGMEGKSLYVWPESLIAPISFTREALKEKGMDPNLYKDYWTDPESKVYQFLGVDNVFFYVLMQGAMWFGTQENPFRRPLKGELQLTDIFSSFHLQVDGQKMSKSKGNFYSGDQLIDELGYDSDQIRYFLAILSLSEKSSNFDFKVLKQRNQFLAGPLNAAFEKPISAVHSKFSGKIPTGKLIGKTEKETLKTIQIYVRFMEKGEFPKALFAVENYARIINGLFNQYRPHDDRFPLEERQDALYSCFYILKNILIMLSPIVPKTMEKLRKSLNLSENVYSIDELGKGMEAGHEIGEQVDYFPH